MTLTEALEEFERESMGGTLALFGEEISDEALMIVWKAAKELQILHRVYGVENEQR